MSRKLDKHLILNILLAVGQTFSNVIIYLSLSFFLKDKGTIDCLFVALSVPAFLLVVWTASISHQLTPVLVSQYSNERLNYSFSKKLIAQLVLIAFIISVFLWFGRSFLLQVLVPGFTMEKLKVTGQLLKWAILLTPIQLTVSIFNSLFITLKRATFAASYYLLGSTIILVLLCVFRHSLTAESVLTCIIIGNLFTLVIFVFEYLRKYFFHLAQSYNFNFKSFYIRLGFTFLILCVSRSFGLIQNSFASSLEGGSIMLLTYSNYLVNITITIFLLPILNLSYALQCEWWSKRENEKVYSFFQRGLYLIFSLGCISGCFIFFAEDFSKDLIITINDSLQIGISTFIINLLILSTFFLICSSFIGRIFYISNRFYAINILDLICILIYVFITFFFSKEYGLVGIYMSFFIYAIMVFTFYLIVLKKRVGFSVFSNENEEDRILFLKLLVGIIIISITIALTIDDPLIKFVCGGIIALIATVFVFRKMIRAI